MKKCAFPRLAAILLVASASLVSQAALAHAHLESQYPAARAVMESSPQALTLTFSEDVEPAFSSVEVQNSQQQKMSTGKVQRNGREHNQLIVPLTQPLPAGNYQVNWHVLSVDGHKTKGSYDFSVK
ncbi:CopC domain-containing protein YobA [[Erwinia] mediterraneensis]|uniref:CopC domain-containing protein YobA n=1 Tax=[Erwinia] mediterraneensis TaxID=2161819 RepID=UPI00102F6965|nr:CopC domain-containing protein YobA [[Erwinia] mediterraneensis]